MTCSRWSTPASRPITIVDDYLAEFWSKVFTSIKVHPDIAVRSGGSLAVAFRKENPKLREVVNTWIRKHGKGDAFRNTIERRYLESVKYAKNAAADAERRKLQAVIELFKKYGAQYNFDYLLMAAQGYQESTLDQNAKSPVGAIGVMQVMPPTGKELNVGDITQIEPNIHAGVKYMRFMMDQYFKDDPMDPLNKGLMTFAAYNAGPGRLRQLRREAEKRGLDPNVWFGNVERVASERIGRETVTYVSNIYKYYVTYRLDDRAAGATRGGEGASREQQVRTLTVPHGVLRFHASPRRASAPGSIVQLPRPTTSWSRPSGTHYARRSPGAWAFHDGDSRRTIRSAASIALVMSILAPLAAALRE